MNIELRDEHGKLESQIIRDTVLAKLIPPVADRSSDLLRFVDPCGDTVLNRVQAEVFATELRSRSRDLTDAAERHSIDSIFELAERCANEVHAYLWLIGD